MFAWINDIDAGSEDGDGSAACAQTAPVGGAVGPPGQAADDQQTATGELVPESPGHLQRVWRRCTRADNRDRRPREDVRPAANPQHGRRIGNRAQKRWVALVVPGDWLDPS